MKKTCLILAAMLCCIMLYAQQPTGDGSQDNPYLLTDYADLQWFAAQVNGGQNGICAKLTADITAGGTWTPIGNSSQRYRGEFDGNGHTISGLSLSDNETSNVGLFGKTADDAHIHHVGVVGCSFSGKDHVGGICGDFANGVIEYCYSTGTIYALTGDGGGLTGSCYTNAHIRQCHTSCAVTAGAGNYGGITGYLWGDVNHCCVMEGKNAEGHVFYGGKTDDAVFADNTAHSEAAFASGEVCWLLNNGVTDGTQKWYQTLGGTDNLPVLDNSHGTVYYGYDGNVLKYSNSPLTPLNSAAYIDVNGEPQTADNVTEITNSSSALNAGWYVVLGNNVQTGTLTCNGEVHLILADGAKLTAAGGDSQAGIQVSGEGNSLTIYGQTAQSGQLIANGGEYAAGIGGGNHGYGSNITINGGEVTANGGNLAAAIGGGNGGDGSNITINGGEVTANGGNLAAGIGGGNCGNPPTPGPTPTPTPPHKSHPRNGFNITINGGIVTATGGISGDGIGGGLSGSGSNIGVATTLLVKAATYPGATVTVIPNDGSDLASELNKKRFVSIEPIVVTYGDYISVSPEFASGDNVAYGTKVTFTAEDRYADNYEFLGFYKESTFDTPITEGVSGQTYTVVVLDDGISVYAKYEEFTPTPYIDANGQEKSIKTTEITSETSTLNAGWYAVLGSNVQTGTLTCNGEVHLILADGAKLTATGGGNQAGINVSGDSKSLTIYGQAAQSGQLFAKGGNNGAGIGGGSEQSSSNITINGGEVTANGGENAAGIGRGNGGNASNIKVAAALTVYADNTNPPTTEISHTDNDIASHIAVFRYVTVKDDATGAKEAAIAAINAAIEGVTNEDIIAIATNAINAINAATSVDVINAIKEQALAAIASAKAAYAEGDDDGYQRGYAEGDAAGYQRGKEEGYETGYSEGDAAGYARGKDEGYETGYSEGDAAGYARGLEEGQAEALGEMGTPCDDCPAVEVTKGDKTVKLYNPEGVTFKKTE